MPSSYADENFFRALLSKAIAGNASDIHLKVGQPPGARIGDEIVYFRTEKITPEDTEAIARIVIGGRPDVVARLPELTELDGAYSARGLGRFRYNVYRQRGTLAVVMRYIPGDIPSIDSLGLPMPVMRELTEKRDGMVLVVGAAGTGKSTSIAAMVGHLNASQGLHIVTIEDPIEFLHRDKSSSVSQREVGFDTPTFAAALRAALRQDPDVIFVGEIRDEETLEISLRAAETGHLVLATMHTTDTIRTINRMLAMMDGDMAENRMRIAACLQGVVAQRLLPKAGGRDLVLAAEVLIASLAVREAIRRPDKNPPLKSLIEKGAHPYGMQTFQMAVAQLASAGLIDATTAEQASAG